MDSYSSTKFMVWTLAPLHRLATDADQASRAKQFVDWVKYEWLTEDGNEHPNILIFDFFSLVAELNPSPANGQQYCLKYDYEDSHTGSDSHPNTIANDYVGPIFAQAVIDALLNLTIEYVESITIASEVGDANTISTPGGSLQLTLNVLPANATNKSISWSIENATGQSTINAGGLVTAVANGSVTAIATARDGSGTSGSYTITISGQSVTTSVIESKTRYKIGISPNNLLIDSDQPIMIDQVKIFNTCGVVVLIKDFKSTSGIIDLPDMVPGNYFVQLISKNSVDIIKIFKP
jgi:hypothetical protein